MPGTEWPRHLEPRYLRAVFGEWQKFNRSQLKGALRAPSFEFVDTDTKLGTWNGRTRTIALARALIHRHPWGSVVEVLRHEMAHQYVCEVMHAAEGESAHGPAFREVCARFGIDGSASGLPASSTEDQRVQRRIEKLLALAGSNNRNEAERAMATAQKLMLVHNIAITPSDYTWRRVGRARQRKEQWERTLSTLLNEHFFVSVLWVGVYDVGTNRWPTQLEVCGTPGNVEMAVWVHDWLSAQADRLHRAEPASTRPPRGRFFAGLMQGFRDRLRESARQSQEEGLVWLGDPGIREFVERRHGRLRTVSFSVRTGDTGFALGFAKGRELVMNRPVTGTAGNSGRALTDGRRS